MASVYIHIPFCISKCAYCDFYSCGGSRDVPTEYINALLREIKRHNITAADTIYFGGGTPSLLNEKQVFKIINACKPKQGAEITLEANPDTVSALSLCGFLSAGVNRISFGVQTADNDSLKRLGRTHSAQQAKTALENAAKAGFKNISGDIMLALGGYSLAEFDKTLSLLKSCDVTHISCYLLKIESGTAFGKNTPQNLPNEDEAADFYMYAVQRLASEGYAQYEISNFAKENMQGQHNLAYWNCRDYIGIGAAAHSCMNGKRFYYPPGKDSFIDNAQIIADGECTVQDFIMLQLRLNTGLNFKSLKDIYNAQLSQKQMAFLRKCAQNNYAVLSPENVYLTSKGMLLQNSILAELL